MKKYFETERLIIRQFKLSDISTFYAYRNNPIVARYQSWDIPYSKEQAKEFVQEQSESVIGLINSWHQLAIELKYSNEHIGDCAVHTLSDAKQAEIGITLAFEHQKKGYALETLRGLFQYLFENHSFHRIIALVDASNDSSLTLMKKAGMRQEAFFKESYFTGSEWTDEVQFAILESEFK